MPAMIIDKQTKYDRQLRLWATSGQSNLENSHICLINANSTGSEILKNLVLPGIGEFTIIDDSIVNEDKVSGNFFLSHEDLGFDTSFAMTKKLNELNSDVKGNSVTQSIEHIISHESSQFWDKFNVVIVSRYIPQLVKLKEILWDKNIPLLVTDTVGFYGSLQLIASETTVVETHDPSRLYDLRIDKPWQELQKFSDSIDLDSLDDTSHAHVPYIVIFIKALQEWKSKHNGQSPKNYSEKQLFRKQIESLSRNLQFETNFIEASSSIHRALQETRIPQSISKLFEHPNIKDENINLSTPIFWIYIKALKNFVALNEYQLPLPGTLPDMASDTMNYVTLQNIYRDKALKDQEQFTNEINKVLHSIGRSEDDINEQSIRSFCKNSQLLHVTQGSKDSYNSTLIHELLSDNITEGDNEKFNTLAIYFALLNYNLYIDKFNNSPSLEDLDQFINLFIEHFVPDADKLPTSILLTFSEILSHNSQEYHNISSLMGGVVSQEVLKLSTCQYIPIDNIFVFDGIRSVSNKWKV